MVTSDLYVYSFFLYQHITNPRKVVGQQDLMINNPLSQDEGVKFVFIPISTSLARKIVFLRLVINHHESSVISYNLCCFVLPHILYHLKPDGNYSMLYTYCFVGSLWSISVECYYREVPGGSVRTKGKLEDYKDEDRTILSRIAVRSWGESLLLWLK